MNEGLKIIFGVGVLLFAIGWFVRPPVPIPPHALVYVNEAEETFLAPIDGCVTEEQKRTLKVKQRKFISYPLRPDKRCQELGGYEQEGISWTESVLEGIGIMEKSPSRWNEDGTWNW